MGAFFEVLPEADVRVCPVPGEVLRRHSKGIALKLEAVLATGEGVAGDRIDFRDRLAGDGEAAASSRPWTMRYEREGACKRVVAVLNTLASNPERALGAGNTDEGKAEEVERERKPKAAK